MLCAQHPHAGAQLHQAHAGLRGKVAGPVRCARGVPFALMACTGYTMRKGVPLALMACTGYTMRKGVPLALMACTGSTLRNTTERPEVAGCLCCAPVSAARACQWKDRQQRMCQGPCGHRAEGRAHTYALTRLCAKKEAHTRSSAWGAVAAHVHQRCRRCVRSHTHTCKHTAHPRALEHTTHFNTQRTHTHTPATGAVRALGFRAAQPLHPPAPPSAWHSAPQQPTPARTHTCSLTQPHTQSHTATQAVTHSHAPELSAHLLPTPAPHRPTADWHGSSSRSQALTQPHACARSRHVNDASQGRKGRTCAICCLYTLSSHVSRTAPRTKHSKLPCNEG